MQGNKESFKNKGEDNEEDSQMHGKDEDQDGASKIDLGDQSLNDSGPNKAEDY